MDLSTLKVGDQILISSSASNERFTPIVGRFATVTAVRSLSFDAGGLCFRKDGTEWSGCYRVLRIFPKGREESGLRSSEIEEARPR